MTMFMLIPESLNYTIDSKKGWEWIPGFFKKDSYQHIVSKWHPLGRTDVYRITSEEARQNLYGRSSGTFQINVSPRPEFAYFSTNFLGGTPAYNLSQESLRQNGIEVKLFSQGMEAPYSVLNEPRVLIIGAGGGRDIFMASTHGAKKIIGAEINPGIVREMSPGGELYEYSGGVYALENAKVYAIDGRHLVKKQQPKSFDLIVLNGVDTFSGLSSGAYSYAESYLYTKNAFRDYLRILDDGGIINLNRWIFHSLPRETLRLEAISLQALKEIGAEEPWKHIIIGATGWSLNLVKKTPFTDSERKTIYKYFEDHGITRVYPPPEELKKTESALLFFEKYAQAFENNVHEVFQKLYPCDISVITDDDPFFYKYYRFGDFNPFRNVQMIHHTGTIIFMTQALIFVQAILFILLFIFLPLLIRKKNDIKSMPKKSLIPFVLFFSCLGLGFMFVEIPIMQRFVLLLGSPIYSITVVLSVLLIATGLGSISIPKLLGIAKGQRNLITAACCSLVFCVLLLVLIGTNIFDYLMNFSIFVRILFVIGMLFPLGFLLGIFFPSGLQLISKDYNDSIAWAWAINCGFSVLGSILSIILAQFIGFNAILLLALVIYLVGLLAFRKLEEAL